MSLARLLCVELALHRENTVLKNRVACKLQKVMASNAFDRLHKKKVAVVTKMFLSAAWQLYRNYDVGIDQLDAAQAKLKNARIQLLSNE